MQGRHRDSLPLLLKSLGLSLPMLVLLRDVLSGVRCFRLAAETPSQVTLQAPSAAPRS